VILIGHDADGVIVDSRRRAWQAVEDIMGCFGTACRWGYDSLTALERAIAERPADLPELVGAIARELSHA
jgi:hypothetical protein